MQELLQAMVTGESVSVPCKGKGTLDLPWRSHLIFKGAKPLWNPFLGISDAPWRGFQRGLAPLLAARALGAYHRAVEQHRAANFWSWCPPELRKVRDSMSASMSPVEKFLGLSEDDEYDFYIRKVEGSYVQYNTLVDTYNEYIDRRRKDEHLKTKEMLNESTLKMNGYLVHFKVHTCRECGNLVKKPRACCDRYHADRRNTARAVLGLELVRKPPRPVDMEDK